MKRIWLGLGVLVALLALGIWGMLRTKNVHCAMAQQLREASMNTDGQQAFQAGEQVYRQWEEQWVFTAALADHSDIDEIDGMFAQLEICRERRDETSHALLCAALSERLMALAENHTLSWANLL